MHIAIEGCCHGCLDDIYKKINEMEISNGYKIDLLIICGDMETMRNTNDMKYCLECPNKYKHMGDFYKYYTGISIAPVLTIFIGGNHESSNYLQELPYGGWVSKNIYYLGYSGVIRVGGLRIGGLSGIYNRDFYRTGHYEIIPYNKVSLKSVYNVKKCEVEKIKLLNSKGLTNDVFDIFISHDWPNDIEYHGDTNLLFKIKPHFYNSSSKHILGSPVNMNLLKSIKPRYWFSGHMHVKFFATVIHDENQNNNDNDDDYDDCDDDNNNNMQSGTSQYTLKQNKSSEQFNKLASMIQNQGPIRSTSSTSEAATTMSNKTEFVALDKCLPNRDFLHIMEIHPHPDSLKVKRKKDSSTTTTTTSSGSVSSSSSSDHENEIYISYDEDWLAIIRATHDQIPTNKYPDKNKLKFKKFYKPVDLKAERMIVRKLFMQNANGKQFESLSQLYRVPDNFEITAPAFIDDKRYPFYRIGNPQTDELLRILHLKHKITLPWIQQQQQQQQQQYSSFSSTKEDQHQHHQ